MNDNSFDLGTPGIRPPTTTAKITSPSLASITDPASPKEKSEPRYSFQRRREYIREWDSWRNQWEASGGMCFPLSIWILSHLPIRANISARLPRSVSYFDSLEALFQPVSHLFFNRLRILALYHHYAILVTSSPLLTGDPNIWQEMIADTVGYTILTRARDAAVEIIRAICLVGDPAREALCKR